MSFAWPQLLWLLAAPAALLAWDLSRRRRAAAGDHPKILRGEAGLGGLTPPQAPSQGARGSRAARPWLAAGLALSVVALARPQWGRLDEPVFEQSREILIALDLSRSMLTADVAPSRLDRAKLLIQSLLEHLQGERVGLEVFSGTAFLQAPLSADYEILREFLPSLSPEFLPEGGTNYAALIDTAAGAFEGGRSSDRFLIVLSDGGATEEDWKSHLDRLKDRGIRVICLGIGTEAGGFIPDGSGGFMKDDSGAVVRSRLESATLREIAEKSGGVYKDASSWVDLASLIKATVDEGRKGRFVEKNTTRHIERYQWALAPALLCLLLSFWREFPVQPKPRSIGIRRDREAGSRAAASAAAAVLALCLAGPGRAAEETPQPSALLGRIVARLSAQPSTGALDWAELGNQTVTWGRQIQSEHQAVPQGPVRDALDAVEAGSAMDPKAADWPRLKKDLEDLLKKPEDRKQQQDKQDQKQQQKNQQQNQQKSQQQKRQNQGGKQQQDQQQQQQQQNEQQQNPQGGDKNGNPQEGKSPFEDMKPPQQRQPQGGTQKVGGSGEKKQADPAEANPNLAVPLEKLDEIRNQDSPAQLFEMIENKEPHPPSAKSGSNW